MSWDSIDLTLLFSLVGGFLTFLLTTIKLAFGNKKLKIENKEKSDDFNRKQILLLESQVAELQKENKELRAKIDNLQNQIVELKSKGDKNWGEPTI